jgi:hypothetical protein
LTTRTTSPPIVAPTGFPETGTLPRRPGSALGWLAAGAIAVSVLLMATIMAAGPSVVIPYIPRTFPWPPLWVPLHLSAPTASAGIYAALVLGAAGVACGLVAVRRGARPDIRIVVAAAVATVAVFTLLPPGGSTDSLSYAAYGRITEIGHNPYVMTPLQLRRSGDPIGQQTTRNWQADPSLYGPVATATEWVAAELGGTTISYIVFWLKLLYALCFLAVALALDRVLRGNPNARARAHLLWTVNPLMLWAVVGGAHADGLGAGLGILGLLVARTTTPWARLRPGRAFAAALLVGAAVAVKAPYAPLALALAWSARHSIKTLAAAAAGGALTLVPGYVIAGPPALADLVWRSSNLVPFDSFWRLFYSPFGYGVEPAGLELIAAAACVGMAALLAWRLPPGPPQLPVIRPALVLMLAWILVWPLQRPWYDAMAFCLLAIVPASRLDWLMLVRALPAAMAVATGAAPGDVRSAALLRIIAFVGTGLSPWVRLGAVVVAVAACVFSAWELRQPQPERLAVESGGPGGVVPPRPAPPVARI